MRYNVCSILEYSRIFAHSYEHTSDVVFANLCCSLLQCVAVCCSVLQCVAVCCSVLQCVAVCVAICVAICVLFAYSRIFTHSYEQRSEVVFAYVSTPRICKFCFALVPILSYMEWLRLVGSIRS